MTTYKPGERVTITCHAGHTTEGGLFTDSHEHTGTVTMTTVRGNVLVALDNDSGPPIRFAPSSLRPVAP